MSTARLEHRIEPQRLVGVACVVALMAILMTMLALPAHAQPAPASTLISAEQPAHDSWSSVAKEMGSILDDAVEKYQGGDAKGGKDTVNVAYYQRYETLGFEKQVMARISGARVSTVEMEFSLLKKAMGDGDDAGVTQHANTLKTMLVEDAATLDGGSADGESYSPGPWGQVAKEMNGILDEAVDHFKNGDIGAGKDTVNVAYYQRYETLGFEKQVMARISGTRVSTVEMEFSLLKKAMNDGNADIVDQHATTLKNYIREDANTLDGYEGTGATESSPWLSAFLPAFLIILREGFEAILVVGAVIAYLIKAGHGDKTKVVWAGTGVAIVCSIVLAVLLSNITALAGQNQELIEGLTALLAVAMLIWVSNWMIGKSSQAAWDRFIKSKTERSLSQGSLFSLAFIAFLAVFREGAETILFYLPVIAQAGNQVHYVWVGLGVGAVCLVIVYLMIRLLAVRIPLRPFFIVTSILLAIMAITFTGSGIKELQEADAFPLTPINGAPTIDLLGIYPRVENLAAQGLVLLIIIGLFVWGSRRNRAQAAADNATPSEDKTETVQ